jgi:transposase
MGRPSKYSPEFREEAVRLYREGDEMVAATAKRLGVCIRSRFAGAQAEADGGDRPGTTRAEHAEIVRLERELRQVEEEKLILLVRKTWRSTSSAPDRVARLRR